MASFIASSPYSLTSKTSTMDRAKFLNVEAIVEAILHSKFREEHTLTFNCTTKELDLINRKLEKLGDRFYSKLSFNPDTQTLELLMMPTPIHQEAAGWLNTWADSLEVVSPQLRKCLAHYQGPEIRDLLGSYAGHVKVADTAIYIPASAKWPRIALEVGYSETHEKLKEDARTILVGTQGGIDDAVGLVISVKIQPLKPGEQRIQKAFVELFVYDRTAPRCIRRVQRLQLFPPVSHPERQIIDLDWNDLQSPKYQFPQPNCPLPPLRLELLRERIEKGVDRYLAQ